MEDEQQVQAQYRIEKYDRFFAVYDQKDELVAVTVYRKGAQEVVRRLRKVEQLSSIEATPSGWRKSR